MDNGLYQEKVIALLVNIQDAVRIIALAVLAIVAIVIGYLSGFLASGAF